VLLHMMVAFAATFHSMFYT